MLSEREKMLRGDLYNAQDPELTEMRKRARKLLRALNASAEEERLEIMAQLLGAMGEGTWIEPPFFCDYGTHITLGKNVFFNFNCVVLDVAHVEIGDNVLFGPNVQIYTATHPIDAETRRTGLELGKPIRIGSDVWVGGSAIILPGVTIGSRTVIGAGSVVTRDLPDDVFAAGNPCRVIRQLA
ncbi:MAG: sugar O-acetyltransferase [Chloroflexota bacterium]|nr:MAG: sugar O-acetyltransferase [Chloroflexota bacterium]